jgi:hypothetical protein
MIKVKYLYLKFSVRLRICFISWPDRLRMFSVFFVWLAKIRGGWVSKLTGHCLDDWTRVPSETSISFFAIGRYLS